MSGTPAAISLRARATKRAVLLMLEAVTTGTSFQHQPEAQHPKSSATHNCRPITPSFGGKADMALCGNPLSRSLLGAKRTCPFAPHMSAFDAVDGAHSAASRVP